MVTRPCPRPPLPDQPPQSAPFSHRWTPGSPVSAPAPIAVGLRSFREQHRESEKLGLTETLLGAERYRSILEIGCGAGELASRLVGRCTRYTGLDEEPASLAAAGRAVRAGRFLPLALRPDEPFRLPPGEHELIVLSEILHRLDAVRIERLAPALDALAEEGGASFVERVLRRPRIGCARTVRALEGTGIACPPARDVFVEVVLAMPELRAAFAREAAAATG